MNEEHDQQKVFRDGKTWQEFWEEIDRIEGGRDSIWQLLRGQALDWLMLGLLLALIAYHLLGGLLDDHAAATGSEILIEVVDSDGQCISSVNGQIVAIDANGEFVHPVEVEGGERELESFLFRVKRDLRLLFVYVAGPFAISKRVLIPDEDFEYITIPVAEALPGEDINRWQRGGVQKHGSALPTDGQNPTSAQNFTF